MRYHVGGDVHLIAQVVHIYHYYALFIFVNAISNQCDLAAYLLYIYALPDEGAAAPPDDYGCPLLKQLFLHSVRINSSSTLTLLLLINKVTKFEFFATLHGEVIERVEDLGDLLGAVVEVPVVSKGRV